MTKPLDGSTWDGWDEGAPDPSPRCPVCGQVVVAVTEVQAVVPRLLLIGGSVLLADHGRGGPSYGVGFLCPGSGAVLLRQT